LAASRIHAKLLEKHTSLICASHATPGVLQPMALRQQAKLLAKRPKAPVDANITASDIPIHRYPSNLPATGDGLKTMNYKES